MSAKNVTPGPEPRIVAAWREAAGLTQGDAADLVHVTRDTWRSWEVDTPGSKRARRMPYGLFELFCVKTEKASKKRAGR